MTTEYYWHWDLKSAKLDVLNIKNDAKLMSKGGLEVFATDDPEITSHPANCLMARIGNRITLISNSLLMIYVIRIDFYFKISVKI